jgi:hypothetical protein
VGRHGFVTVSEDDGPAKAYNFDGDLNNEEFVIIAFELDDLWLVHLVEVEGSDVVVEFGAVGANELEGDNDLMLLFGVVPPEVNFLERGTGEVFVLDPRLVIVGQGLLIDLEIDQLHIVLYLDQGVLLLDQFLENDVHLLALLEDLGLEEQPIGVFIFRANDKNGFFEDLERERRGVVPSVRQLEFTVKSCDCYQSSFIVVVPVPISSLANRQDEPLIGIDLPEGEFPPALVDEYEPGGDLDDGGEDLRLLAETID